MGKHPIKWLYRQYVQIRGSFKWQVIWSFLEPHWKEWVLPYWQWLLGAMVSMTGTAIAYFWEWVTELHPLVIFFILFSIYVLVWALIALIVFIFRGKEQAPVTTSPTPAALPPSEPPTPPEPKFAIEYVSQWPFWRAPNEDNLHLILPDRPAPDDAHLVLKVRVRITAPPMARLEEIWLEVQEGPLPNPRQDTLWHDHNNPNMFCTSWKPEEISEDGMGGVERDVYCNLSPPLPLGPYRMRLLSRAYRIRMNAASRIFDVHISRHYLGPTK